MLSSLLTYWLCLISGVAATVTGTDKRAAQLGNRRVPEIVLLLIALLGGSFAMLIAMRIFHHKTRKSSFQLVLVLIILLQVGIFRLLASEFIYYHAAR